MAKQTVNIGQSANDRTGDSLRTSFEKINSNFSEVYVQSVPTSPAGKSGDEKGMIAVDEDYVYICVADFDESTVIWKRIELSNDSW
jgi:hypothetical protein